MNSEQVDSRNLDFLPFTFPPFTFSYSMQPIIILVETQLAENIGMCARAMLNCGLDELRLVNPRDGWPNDAAVATAADADVVLQKANCYSSVESAVEDCHRVFATTARNRSRELPVLDSKEAAVEVCAATGLHQKVAILFGPEASGLDNESLTVADCLINFSTNPKFSSLNLAQAVLLFGWEWKRTSSGDENVSGNLEPAKKADLSLFLERLEESLDEAGFFLTPDTKSNTSQNLRTFFSRATPSDKELRLLQGMLTALTKR